MGQAFRRAAGKLRNSSIDTPSSSSSSSSSPSQYPNAFDPKPPPLLIPNNHLPQGVSAKTSVEEPEQRDPKYDAMLNAMSGRISAKPGGKLEMGEAFVVQKSTRPMPKARNTTPDSGRYEERQVAAGTLNVSQLRHIMLLYKGKADDQVGPMALEEIARRFRVDDEQLKKILQVVSLPSQDNNKKIEDM